MLPVSAEVVKADRVLLRVHDRKELIFDFDELPGIYLALKDGVLHSLSIVEACLGYLAQPCPSSGCGGGDIVGDQGIHLRSGCELFGEEGGVGIEITAEMAGEETGLYVRKEAESCLLSEKWMREFGLFAFLPVLEDDFAGVGF